MTKISFQDFFALIDLTRRVNKDEINYIKEITPNIRLFIYNK